MWIGNKHGMCLLIFILASLCLVGATFTVESQEELEELASFVENVASLGNTELNFISDFTTRAQTRLIKILMEKGRLPISIHEIRDLRKKQIEQYLPAYCPIVIPNSVIADKFHFNLTQDYEIYIRKHLIQNQKYQRTIVVWVGKDFIHDVQEVFANTIMKCAQVQELGVYNLGTKFYYLSGDKNETGLILTDVNAKRHPSVASVEKVGSQKTGILAIYSYNLFHENNSQEITLNYVWSRSNLVKNWKQLFSNLADDFNGHKLRVCTLPWAYFILATPRSDKDDGFTPNNRYKDYWGYEMDMFLELSFRLNFTFSMTNPVDGLWVGFSPEGIVQGILGVVGSGEADVGFGDMIASHDGYYYGQFSRHYDWDYITFASPLPGLRPKYMALLQPFDLLIWIFLPLSLIVVSTALWLLSQAEGQISLIQFRDWSNFKKSLWYCYGTLLGESLSRDTNSVRGHAIRWILAVWMLSCFLLSSSYAGIVKAFLTNPYHENPINTLSAIVNSGLPWEWSIYGTLEESVMTSTDNPILKKLWEGKTVIPYSPIPPLDKVSKGEATLLEYKSGLAASIFVNYTTPTGQFLVYLHPVPPLSTPYGTAMIFPKLNLWAKKFDYFIGKMIEAGLIGHWEKAVRAEMKVRARESGYIREHPKERPEISALLLDDTQGMFLLHVLILGLSLLVFWIEVALGLSSRNRRRRRRDVPATWVS